MKHAVHIIVIFLAYSTLYAGEHRTQSHSTRKMVPPLILGDTGFSISAYCNGHRVGSLDYEISNGTISPRQAHLSRTIDPEYVGVQLALALMRVAKTGQRTLTGDDFEIIEE